MEVLGDISNFCRFCLSQDCESLMPLSSAIESLSFSLQDIQETTGISILASETACLAVCATCSNRIELAVDFRRSCLNGNVLFMQLFGHIIDKLRLSDIAEENFEVAYAKNDPLNIEIILKNEPTDESTYEEHNEPALQAEESHDLIEEPTNKEEEDCDDENNTFEDIPSVAMLRSKRKTAFTVSQQRMVKSKEWIGDKEGVKPNKPKASGKHRKRLCGICGALVYNLIVHTRSHTKENMLQCPHCPVQMAHATNLRAHVRAFHEKTIFKSCEPCGKGFITLDSYKTHLRTYHNIGKQYQCEVCLKIFKHPSNRRDHIRRMHIGELKYECQICQKKFKDPYTLKLHGRVHSANTPYACSQCPKQFKSAFAQKTHEITHSGIDFPCTICPKVYRYKSQLSIHYRKCHPVEDDE
ncbi:zinc finger protein 77-like isoform X2 [Anopheles aquasalis]|uniref:zinc finger protein 77-like isoform X2 n=1 Tax=Anopheles aquasalis TaxID=42839 RepID=UPI00215B3927|nr:zinc finger protein 77-like isoform X2 [Anopheles aquasalis]